VLQHEDIAAVELFVTQIQKIADKTGHHAALLTKCSASVLVFVELKFTSSLSDCVTFLN